MLKQTFFFKETIPNYITHTKKLFLLKQNKQSDSIINILVDFHEVIYKIRLLCCIYI